MCNSSLLSLSSPLPPPGVWPRARRRAGKEHRPEPLGGEGGGVLPGVRGRDQRPSPGLPVRGDSPGAAGPPRVGGAAFAAHAQGEQGEGEGERVGCGPMRRHRRGGRYLLWVLCCVVSRRVLFLLVVHSSRCLLRFSRSLSLSRSFSFSPSPFPSRSVEAKNNGSCFPVRFPPSLSTNTFDTPRARSGKKKPGDY